MQKNRIVIGAAGTMVYATFRQFSATLRVEVGGATRDRVAEPRTLLEPLKTSHKDICNEEEMRNRHTRQISH